MDGDPGGWKFGDSLFAVVGDFCEYCVCAMEFRTRVEVPSGLVEIGSDDCLTFMGSCFADYIGGRAVESGLDAAANPLGVVYNPLSMAALLRAVGDVSWRAEDGLFVRSEGVWRCWLTDGSLWGATLQECRERVEEAVGFVRGRVRKRGVLLLTLGTNRFYELRGGPIVGNCHKQPGGIFDERAASVEDIVAVLGGALELLWSLNEGLRVVFTVSPYRYAKYGLHGNSLSKAALLLSVDCLCRRYGRERCGYFPAYEIVNDELRDYRFYAADMLHVSQTGVDYVWERFSEGCLTGDALRLIEDWLSVVKAVGHRPLHPESPVYREFVEGAWSRAEGLALLHPHLKQSGVYVRLEELHREKL